MNDMFEYDAKAEIVRDTVSGATIEELPAREDGRPPPKYFLYRDSERSFEFAIRTGFGGKLANAKAEAEGLKPGSAEYRDRVMQLMRESKVYHHEFDNIDDDVMPMDHSLAERIMRMIFVRFSIAAGNQYKQTAGLINHTPGQRDFRRIDPYLKIDEHGQFFVKQDGRW